MYNCFDLILLLQFQGLPRTKVGSFLVPNVIRLISTKGIYCAMYGSSVESLQNLDVHIVPEDLSRKAT